ncbi:hypothetical protein LAZ67_10001713 [Cordylochernes scorpioides]|uniref:Endonuclease/exonuclease/phosphatase domain-containing protein n=1 Tax=Cordylochernes scorpioides TaxID=51811 RepID=A0ABY6KW10_9ARAC|nr:hypothetical protein LAZ67_10001713 [Cordylochernes scorpioides]
MDKLKKACETKKRTLESVIAEADGELGKCKDRFLIASDCLIEQLIKADREDEEIEDVDIVQANLFGRSEGVLQKMEQLLAKPTVDRQSIVSGGNEGKSNLHRLPKLELPKFGGQAREWLQFWSAFQSVHDDDSISACVKFQYLQNCMIKGSVSEEIVSSFPNSAANYPLSISTLKERFGREDMLVEVYVRDLIAIILENAHGRNTTSFSTVYVRLSSQLRALGSLGVTTDKCAAILYPMVESALPEDLFVAWERTRHHHKPDEDGKHNSSEALLEKLMEFLKHEVEGSERMRLARQPFSSSYPSQFNRDKPPKPKTSVATAASLLRSEEYVQGSLVDMAPARQHQQNADLSFVKNFHFHQDLIMVKHNGVLKAVVPESFQEEILKECHDNHSHPSINKTETKLNPNLRFNIKGYTTLRKDRPGKFGGGLAVLIKTLEIKYKEIAYNQSKPRESTTEAQAIDIYLPEKTINIINVYHHDNTSINTGLIETLIEASLDIAIKLGDFNAERPNWGSPVQDNKGQQVEDMLTDLDLTPLNNVMDLDRSPEAQNPQ